MKIKNYNGQKVLVALSGGADSVALLCLLHEQRADIEALHCNFHLRGEESDRDEQFVTRLCQRRGIPLHVRHFETRRVAEEKGISIEMAARELRYQWFEEMRQRIGANYIAVAHHRDDQAETVLLNLIRGTGIRGLAGMHEQNGHIIRPLLHVSKEELLKYLQSIRQDFVTDSTNMKLDALRNRIRLEVLPLLQQINPHATAHIAEAASRVAEAIPYYIKGVDNSDEFTASTLHERLQGYGFTPAQEADILRNIEGTSGAVFESPTHRLLRDRGKLVLEVKEKADLPPILEQDTVEVDDPLGWLSTQPSPLPPAIAYLDADKVRQPLLLRHTQAGDRFQPFGMKKGTRLVSDFLTDLKLNLFEKQRQWLVCSEDHIVWVCGLRIDEHYRVTRQTRRILILKTKSITHKL